MRVLTAFGMLVAIAMGGCGGEDDEPLSREAYRDELIRIGQEHAEAEDLYYDMVVREIPQNRCTTLIQSFHGEVHAGVESVAALEPPSFAADVHIELTTAARESVARVDRIRDRVAAGEIRCGNQLNELLYGMPSTERAERAMDALRDLGMLPPLSKRSGTSPAVLGDVQTIGVTSRPAPGDNIDPARDRLPPPAPSRS